MIDKITLLIGGQAHQDWESYRIDSSLLTPTDDFQMTISGSGSGHVVPSFVFEGAPVELMVGEEIVLSGIIESIDENLDKQNLSIELYGKDRACLLVDCSAPLLSLQNATLEEIIKKAVTPLGIKAVRYDAKPADPRQTVHTEPGQSPWEWLQQACEINQVWPSMAPDGTLVIGVPDYTTPPVATLICRRNGDGNNIIALQRTRSIQGVWSEVTVLGQAQGDGEVGRHDIKGVAKDPTVNLYRPHTVIDGNCESNALAKNRANKILADSKMVRQKIKVVVEGHRITGVGALWLPGQRVHLLSEPHQIDAIFFIIRRSFVLNRNEGATTELHLIADGSWLLNLGFIKSARSKKFAKRKGRYARGADDDEFDGEGE